MNPVNHSYVKTVPMDKIENEINKIQKNGGYVTRGTDSWDGKSMTLQYVFNRSLNNGEQEDSKGSQRSGL